MNDTLIRLRAEFDKHCAPAGYPDSPNSHPCREYAGPLPPDNLTPPQYCYQLKYGKRAEHRIIHTCMREHCVEPTHVFPYDESTVIRLGTKTQFPVSKIAKIMGMSRPKVYRILKEHYGPNGRRVKKYATGFHNQLMTVEEIVELTGLPEATIRQRLARGDRGMKLCRRPHAR